MDRREFVTSALAWAGLSRVVQGSLLPIDEKECLLLTVPYGHCMAHQQAREAAVET